MKNVSPKLKVFLIGLVILFILVTVITSANDRVREREAVEQHIMELQERISELESENTQLITENEDFRGTLVAVREIVKQLDYETILIREEQTNTWLRTVEQFIGGTLNE